MRLGLLMRQMALDWNLSKRQTVDLERHPRRGRSTIKKDGFRTCIQLVGEEVRKTRGLWQENRAFEMHVSQGNGYVISK